MSILPKIIICTIFFAIGAGIIFFSGSALFQASNWIMAVIYISVIAVGMAFVAIGWAVASGANIKDMIKDLFSGISF